MYDDLIPEPERFEYRSEEQEVKEENIFVIACICVGMSIAIVILWLGLYYGSGN
jgi:hypothetical protein